MHKSLFFDCTVFFLGIKFADLRTPGRNVCKALGIYSCFVFSTIFLVTLPRAEQKTLKRFSDLKGKKLCLILTCTVLTFNGVDLKKGDCQPAVSPLLRGFLYSLGLYLLFIFT